MVKSVRKASLTVPVLGMATDVPTVLVTGASGYIATHIVQQLQQDGLYKVRGTVRSTKNEEKIAPLKNLCPGAKYPLELVEADLSDESTWLDAVKGCTYVLHTASPFPSENPKHEDEVIKPAVDGTLSVLRACRAAGCVKRVVLTSSGAAMEWTPDKGRVFTEADWSDLNARGISPYYRSKTLAEKAAWNFVKELPVAEKFELAVMNPTFVIGPVLSGGISTSQVVPKRLLERQLPALPALGFNVVDVRDVARAHINGMTVPEAAGNRHILAIRHAWFSDMAKALDEEFKPQGYNIPTSTAPNALVRFVGLFDSTIKMITPLLGKEVVLYSDRMTKVLGITPISMKQSLVDMAYSMIEAGKIKKTSRYRGPPAPPAQNTRM